MRIVKMLLRLISLPMLFASLLVHILLALIIGLSSIVVIYYSVLYSVTGSAARNASVSSVS